MSVMMLAGTSLSRVETLRAMNKRFSEVDPNATRNTLLIMIMFCGLIGIIWMLHRWQRSRQERKETPPMGLFIRVLRKMDLSWADRFHLWHIAVTARCAHPSAILISSRLFDITVEQYENRAGRLHHLLSNAAQLHALRERFFDDEPQPVVTTNVTPA